MNFKQLLTLFIALLVGGCQGGCAAVTYIEKEKPTYVSNTQNVEHLMNSVVFLVNQDETGQVTSHCSAFFVEERKIATAAHCVTEVVTMEIAPGMALQFMMEPVMGKEFKYVNYAQYKFLRNVSEIEPYSARLVAINTDTDVAILDLTPTSPRSTHFLPVNSTTVNIGEHVYSIGHPGTLFWILTDGLVSQLTRNENGFLQYIHASSNIFYGNSGGPLINERGEVIGVASMIAHEQSHLGIFSPAKNIVNLLNSLRPMPQRQ